MNMPNEKANYSQGVLVFSITRQQRFALGTLKIQEIVPYQSMYVFPNSNPSVLGVIPLRGKTVPILDMAASVGFRPLNEEEKAKGVIIVTDCQRKTVGFLVRSIEKIMEFNWNDIQSPPKSAGLKACITGVCHINDQLIQLVDLEYVLSNVFPDDPSNHFAVLTDVQREKLKPMNILLVDDSLVARKQLSDALNHMNILYQVTDDGTLALEIMKNAANEGRPIDLLVSDIEMPGLDGYELAFSIRDDPTLRDAYIVLHSSLSSHISLSQARQVGANEALTKFNVHELIAAMLRGAEMYSRT